MKLPWDSKHAPLVAFAIIAIGGAVGLQESNSTTANKLYEGQLAACQRGNVLREESNSRVESMEVVKGSVKDFLTTARTARLTAYEADRNQFDKQAANDYTRLIRRIEDDVKFDFVPLVDCAQAVERP